MPLPPVVALEVGTSKIVALVGELREDGCVMITGMGMHESIGVRKGEIVDFENVALCVRSVLAEAEKTGKVAIGQIHLVLSGGHIQSMKNRGTVPVMGPDREISQDDVDQVMEVASAVNLPPDRKVIHTICQHFCIDGQELVVKPEGMEGAQLSLDMLILHGVRNSLNNTVNVVRSVSVEVQDSAFSGLCSAMAVLSPEQKKAGVLLVDLGAGTSDYVVYSGNIVAVAGSLGIGGDHITNDLSLAFNIPRLQAEVLKRKFGSAIIDGDDKKVSLPAEAGFSGCTLGLGVINTVVNARCDELFSMIRHQVGEEFFRRRMGAGVVLTGGGAHMRGIKDLAEKVFNLPCTIGKPRGISGLATVTSGPEFAACAGMVQYGFRTGAENERGSVIGKWIKDIFGK